MSRDRRLPPARLERSAWALFKKIQIALAVLVVFGDRLSLIAGSYHEGGARRVASDSVRTPEYWGRQPRQQWQSARHRYRLAGRGRVLAQMLVSTRGQRRTDLGLGRTSASLQPILSKAGSRPWAAAWPVRARTMIGSGGQRLRVVAD